MSNCNDETLCDITRGDTIPFQYQFKNADGTPKDVAGKSLHFVMYVDPEQKVPDLHYEEIFPVGVPVTSGVMNVPPHMTIKLTGGQCYLFAFKLIGGIDEVFTLGAGSIKVNKNAPLAVPTHLPAIP